jgi:PAS domain S-box-containing protein
MTTDARGLANRRTQLQRLLESATPVVFAKDPDGRYLFVNREWERVHWGRTGDVTGLTDFDIFPAEVAARYRENDLLVLGDECAHQFEETVVVDGIERTYVTAKFPLLDASGLPYAVCGMATDITERRRIEDALSSAALAVSSSEGGALFSELVRYLATILDVDSAFISKPVDGGDTMRMLAIHLNGETREHFDYSIAGTACQTVMSKGFGVYQSGLAELLGTKREFVGMRPESYAGCRLNDRASYLTHRDPAALRNPCGDDTRGSSGEIGAAQANRCTESQ